MTLRTVGHGTLPAEQFTALLEAATIDHIVDIRSYPGSRHNPQFGRDAMERWLPEAGIRYSWLRALGGRRKPQPGSPHTALRNDAFRAYADHMQTDEFRHGLTNLLADHELDRTAVMCSESVWWRCHRRLLADHVVLVEKLEVVHLMHDSRHTLHRVTEGARRDGDDVVYDLGATPPLPVDV
jgi:uncharacterized protein (DUF488 family)